MSLIHLIWNLNFNFYFDSCFEVDVDEQLITEFKNLWFTERLTNKEKKFYLISTPYAYAKTVQICLIVQEN